MANRSNKENESYRMFVLLDEISKNNYITQRALSERLGIALGLTNSFIKRLCKKGYIKITTISPNKLKYLITPKGIAEKTRLTFEFIQYSFRFYKEARKRLYELFLKLGQNGVRNVIFYGAGDLGEIAYFTLEETNLKLVGVVDDYKKGGKLFKYNIKDPSELKILDYDRVIVTSIRSKMEIIESLKNMNIPEEKIEVFN
jgi:DNA-binding MarR family transcriptional regulator